MNHCLWAREDQAITPSPTCFWDLSHFTMKRSMSYSKPLSRSGIYRTRWNGGRTICITSTLRKRKSCSVSSSRSMKLSFNRPESESTLVQHPYGPYLAGLRREYSLLWLRDPLIFSKDSTAINNSDTLYLIGLYWSLIQDRGLTGSDISSKRLQASGLPAREDWSEKVIILSTEHMQDLRG